MLESNPPRDSRSGYRRNVERGDGPSSALPTPQTPFQRFPPCLKKLKAKSCLESNPSCRIHAEPRQQGIEEVTAEEHSHENRLRMKTSQQPIHVG